MIANRSKRIGKNKGQLFSNKKILIIIGLICLFITLIFSNVSVSAKTYKLINCNKQLDELKTEFKDLNEEKEVLISPVRIREKAINDLEMVDIENIDELLLIQP